MSEIKRESPLIGQADAVHGSGSGISGGISLRERPFIGHITVRGKDTDAAFTSACEKVLGVALPTTPNTEVRGSDCVVCWLRPTEWLVLTERNNVLQLQSELRAALAGAHAAVVDLSSAQTLIEIRGAHAADTLSKGTTFDLHPRTFAEGQCTRTLLTKTTVFIRVVEPGQAFQVIVRRSFADYLWQWLRDAASEYGCLVDTPEASLSNTVQLEVANG